MNSTFMSLFQTILETYKIDYPLDKSILNDYSDLVNELLETPFDKSDETSSILFTSSLYTLFWGVLSLSMMQGKEGQNYSQISLYAVSSSITNCLTSIIDLSKKGLDFSAQILLRNLFEAAHLFAVILANPQKRLLYFNSGKELSTHKVWNEHFRMAELKKELLNIEKSRFGDDKEYFRIIKKWRNEKYSYYSNHVHNDFFHTYYNTYTEADNQDDIILPNLWGINGASRINNLLNNLNDMCYWLNLFTIRVLHQDKLFDDKEIFIGTDFVTDAKIIHTMAVKQHFDSRSITNP